MSPEQKLILDVYGALMISPQGYHMRGAASKAFDILMSAQDVVNAAYEAKWAEEKLARPKCWADKCVRGTHDGDHHWSAESRGWYEKPKPEPCCSCVNAVKGRPGGAGICACSCHQPRQAERRTEPCRVFYCRPERPCGLCLSDKAAEKPKDCGHHANLGMGCQSCDAGIPHKSPGHGGAGT